MLCQFCGSANPPERETCQRCGTKLLVLSGVLDELPEFDEENLFRAQEELEEHILERITGLEDAVRQLSDAVAATARHLGQLEHNLTVTHAGVQTLGSLLESEGILSRAEVVDGWERMVSAELLSRDLSRRYAERSERILSLASHTGRDTPQFRRKLRALELALVDPDAEVARDLLTELARLAPDNDELWGFIGEAAFQVADLESARIAFRRVLALRGPHYETLIYLGTVASDLGRWEEAENALRGARDMAPETFLPHFTLGALAAMRGNHAAAIEHLETSLDCQEASQAYYLLGVSHLKMGHTGRAIGSFRRAVELEPDFEDALYQLGVAYLRRGWNRLAVDTFEQVLQLDPQRLEYQETVRLLNLSPPENLPPEVAGIVRRAEEALERGRPQSAYELFARALAAGPDQWKLQATTALLASALGHARSAIAIAHRLLRANPEGSPFLAAAVVAVLEALRRARRPRAARRIARSIYENGTDRLARGMAAYELALVESELDGDLGGARELAREALEITPKELRHYPLAALGAIALKRRRFREATKYLEQAAEASSAPPLLRQLAVARLGTGDTEGAEEALREAQGHRGVGIDEELLGHVRRLGRLVEDLTTSARPGSRRQQA